GCHDADLHAKLAPQGSEARVIFDAVEQARVESLGSVRMPGIGMNIAAMNAEKYSKANFNLITKQDDAPMAEAMAMLVREQITDQNATQSAGQVLELWRPYFENTVGKDLNELSDLVGDQKAFSRVVRRMLTSMQMAEDMSEEDTDPDAE